MSCLKPSALNDLTKSQVNAFADDQLAELNERQIKKADDFIDSLSSGVRRTLIENRIQPRAEDLIHEEPATDIINIVSTKKNTKWTCTRKKIGTGKNGTTYYRNHCVDSNGNVRGLDRLVDPLDNADEMSLVSGADPLA